MTATAATTQVGVLNASYEPLGPTQLDRAMALVLRGDAVIEESDEKRILRHVHGEFPWPQVIRLLHYRKVSLQYGPQGWSKGGVLRRDGFICGYCGKKADTVDHIFPQSRGGKNEWLNTVASCKRCNSIKADHLLEDTRLNLMITPTVPTRVLFVSTKKAKKRK